MRTTHSECSHAVCFFFLFSLIVCHARFILQCIVIILRQQIKNHSYKAVLNTLCFLLSRIDVQCRKVLIYVSCRSTEQVGFVAFKITENNSDNSHTVIKKASKLLSNSLLQTAITVIHFHSSSNIIVCLVALVFNVIYK